MTPTFKGELQLMNWGESSSNGAWVKFWIAPEDLEAFRSLKCRSGKIAGHRMAAVLVEIGEDEKPVEIPKTEHKGGALARLAGIWCQDRRFYDFIRMVYDKEMGGNGDGCGDITPEEVGGIEGYCRHAILVICDIESRAELDSNKEAAEIFHRRIREPFAAALYGKIKNAD